MRKSDGFSRWELDCADVAIDQKTGAILAAVGGTDFKSHQYDCALQAERPAGSTFKTLAHLAYFESGGSSDQEFPGPQRSLSIRSGFSQSDNNVAFEGARRAG